MRYHATAAIETHHGGLAFVRVLWWEGQKPIVPCTVRYSSPDLATIVESPWLTAAAIRREIVMGLKAWFEQTVNTLEAAAAEDADEVAICMGTDEDDPDDSDYNSIDA
jgi:hypothetical protein